MRIKSIAAIAAIALTGGFAATGASAAGKAETKVTIKGGPDFYGYVKSSDPANCAEGRTVKLFKLVDGQKELIASDTASANGARYMWSTGNTGAGNGKYFAKAPATPDCRADKSKVVQVNSF